MPIDNLISYGVLGAKEEFADWISDITPHDTPFVSETGKAPIYNRVFEWQTDRLNHAADNAWSESDIPESILAGTTLHNNYTQILRKVVQVSNTTEAMSSYGRDSELEYQIEKASKELKLEIEAVYLSLQDKDDGSSDGTRRMSGFYSLVAGLNVADPETGAVVHKKAHGISVTEKEIFDITENLYMAGSRANTIMFHPVHARAFADFMGNAATRKTRFLNTDENYSQLVTEITDPLGQTFRLVPNHNMSPYMIYFYHPHDWFQRVLRAPKLTQLDTDGNYEKWMIETELSLQHRNPFASGILEFQNSYTLGIKDAPTVVAVGGAFTARVTEASGRTPDAGSVVWSVNDTSIATVEPNTGVVRILDKKQSFQLHVKASFEGGKTNAATFVSVDVVDALIKWKTVDDTGLVYTDKTWYVDANLVFDDDQVVYTSSDPTVVSIGSHSGYTVDLHYLTAGTAEITATLTIGSLVYTDKHTVVIS